MTIDYNSKSIISKLKEKAAAVSFFSTNDMNAYIHHIKLFVLMNDLWIWWSEDKWESH